MKASLIVVVVALAARAQTGSVDPKICAGCHAEIAKTYALTGMSRAFYRPADGDRVENFSPDSSKNLPFFHAPTRAYYSMEWRGNELFQQRWQEGAGGQRENQETWRVDYVMGSGHHVRTYLHAQANGALIELPLAWYAERGGYWAMNPGYDANHFIAPRKIAYECMFCHNAYPRIPPQNARPNSVPVYLDPLAAGIDCQRCHGPGAAHVAAARRAGASAETIRRAIVNPRRLSGDAQMEVCMQCHLQTTSERLPAAIRKFDRGPFSYRAGEPLGNFQLSFDRATGSGDKFEIVSSVVRLRESKCFLESKGALTCLTCHDPHAIPRGEAAAAHYNAACAKCHAQNHAPKSDCISCHMPKRRTTDVVHAVITDHFIQRRPQAGDLLAEIAETHETEATAYHGEVIPYYPKNPPAIYPAVAQVEHGSNLTAGIPRLEAEIAKLKRGAGEFYFTLAEAYRQRGDFTKAAANYEQAASRDPQDAWTLRRWADALGHLGDWTRAGALVNRAIVSAPADARSWYAQGEIATHAGRPADAIRAFRKAAALDPDLPEAYNNLGSLLAESGDMKGAEDAFAGALRVQPDLESARANLEVLRVSIAWSLARSGHAQEAAEKARAALAVNPHLPDAHLLLGNLLQNAHQLPEAIAEYRAALRDAPNLSANSGRAQIDLGTALAESGDIAAAEEQLRRAAQNPDAAVRQRAQAVLRQLGRP